jgi:HlyD family secretion protein
MSTPAVRPPASPATRPEPLPVVTAPRRRRRFRRLVLLICFVLAVAAIGWRSWRLFRSLAAGSHAADVPTTRVKRGDVALTVTAKGELRGGNSEELAAPMTGEGELHIIVLQKAGDVVKEGDVVVQFDTTDQAFKLREAEADLAEAEQQVIKAKADGAALQENSYALLKAKADVRQAELDCRKNPTLSAIVAKQNDLALQSVRDRLAQLEQDVANFKATNEAGIAIQDAARSKAQVQAATARRNIEGMTVHAHRTGYVAIRQNPNINWGYRGMTLPPFRVGDRVNPGMVIAEIPDLNSWVLGANIGELDRGHLGAGEPVEIQIVAVPFHKFNGHIKDMGGTTGPPWDRHFECKITLDDPAPELRPGMNANLVVHAETLRNVLSVPGQAVFDSDGRTFVWAKSGSGFAPADVKLVRRTESQAVITGISEGRVVALANPQQQAEKKAGGGALQALQK